MEVSNLEQRMEDQDTLDNNNSMSTTLCGIKQINSNTDSPSHTHTESSRQAKDFRCKNCDENLPSPIHLVYHMQVAHCNTSDSIAAMLKCRFCNASFTRKDSLLIHMQGRHAVYSCTMCEEIFEGAYRKKGNSNPFSRYLNHNKEKHDGKASFSFNLRKNEIGEHKCQQCIKSFSTMANMYYHMATDHTELKCVFCEYSIVNKSHALLEHLRIHTGEKIHVCEFCGKKFTARKTLANHVKLHTGEKNYSCTQCGAKFAQLNGLIVHWKKHIGKVVVDPLDALMCKVCGWKFKNIKHLRRHEAVHSGVKFLCNMCKSTFSRRDKLTVHMKKKHSQVGFDDGMLCEAAKYENDQNLMDSEVEVPVVRNDAAMDLCNISSN